MKTIPKDEYGKYKSESRILLRMLSEELNRYRKLNPDWADTGEVVHVRHALKKVLADMRLKPGSDETEVGKEIEKEISVRKERKVMTENADFNVTFLPDNDDGIKEGYYSMNGIVELLRKHKKAPEKIQFIADMLEE